MKSNACAARWLALATILALWAGMALTPAIEPSAIESGFGMLQWKTA